MQGDPWPFGEGWEGFLGSLCLREPRRGVEEQRGTWWPQKGEGIPTLAEKEERERAEGGPVQENWAFRGGKTTRARETAREPEEEGCGPPRHHWNV